jgi:hypothetical protein
MARQIPSNATDMACVIFGSYTAPSSGREQVTGIVMLLKTSNPQFPDGLIFTLHCITWEELSDLRELEIIYFLQLADAANTPAGMPT